jgi:hypothetical protein
MAGGGKRGKRNEPTPAAVETRPGVRFPLENPAIPMEEVSQSPLSQPLPLAGRPHPVRAFEIPRDESPLVFGILHFVVFPWRPHPVSASSRFRVGAGAGKQSRQDEAYGSGDGGDNCFHIAWGSG